MAKRTKPLKDELGDDRVKEIIEKDWKVAEMPSEEELAAEEPKHPKARNNPNSRKNLIQYRKKTPEQKKKMLENLQHKKVEEDVDPKEALGKFYSVEAIEKFFPAKNILKSRKEQETYYDYLRLMLSDFDSEDLTSSDIDDIITLALNRVLENRILEFISNKAEGALLDAMPTLEKMRKSSEKIKANLGSRRADRIDLKQRPAMSVTNLADYLDAQDKADMDARLKKMEQERKTYTPPERDEDGYLIE